jgi:hypothetical protein
MAWLEVLLGAWPAVLVGLIVGIVLGAIVGSRLHQGRPHPAARSAQEISALAIEPHHPFLVDFLRANLADIQRSQPDFILEEVPPLARLIMRQGLPAGVFLGEPQGQELTMVLDYVTPGFRDSKSGRWLFGDGRATFTDAGFKRLVASPTTYEHRTYLETLGFHPEGSRFVREL